MASSRGVPSDDDPVVEVPLPRHLFVQVFAGHGEDGEGLIFAQRGPGVGRRLLVGVDEEDAFAGLGEAVGGVERQGRFAGAALLVEECQYGHWRMLRWMSMLSL